MAAGVSSRMKKSSCSHNISKTQLDQSNNRVKGYIQVGEGMEPLIYYLIKNAIIHNLKGGLLEVNFIDNILILKNSGQNTSHSSVDIFKRFYRDQENKKSLGIGLSIVKRICDLYNFKIKMTFKTYKMAKTNQISTRSARANPT